MVWPIDYLREINGSDRQRETYLASCYVTWWKDPSLPSTQACSWCLHTCSLDVLPREQLLIHLNADSPVYLENLFRINFPLGGRECILEQSVRKTNSCPVWYGHQQNRVHADSPCLCSSLQARRQATSYLVLTAFLGYVFRYDQSTYDDLTLRRLGSMPTQAVE